MSKKDSIDDICVALKSLNDMFFFSPLDYQKQVLFNAIAFFEGKSDFGYVEEVNRIAHKIQIKRLTNECRLYVLRVYLGYINSFQL